MPALYRSLKRRMTTATKSGFRPDPDEERSVDRSSAQVDAASHPLLRYRERSAADFSDQQFPAPRTHHCRLVSRSLARGVVFRWIKQHLHIKSFFGTSENAVKRQIWVAITVYVLVAIVEKQAQLDLSLYKILQLLSITLFEKTLIFVSVFSYCRQPRRYRYSYAI